MSATKTRNPIARHKSVSHFHYIQRQVLSVPGTVLALVFALALPGTPPMLTSCQALPIYWETSCSLLSFQVCLASVYLDSFCEMVTFSVAFDVASLLLNPHLTVLH